VPGGSKKKNIKIAASASSIAIASVLLCFLLINTLQPRGNSDNPNQKQDGNRGAAAKQIICLDPGHADTPSEIDPETGLNTQDWINEPEIGLVYDITLRTKAILETQGVVVVLTKNSVYEKVNLKQREEIANKAGAALILHIHTDPGLHSPTTFYPGAAPDNWRGNSRTGRKAYIDPGVQRGSERMAKIFHAKMSSVLHRLTNSPLGSVVKDNRGPTPSLNYGPLYTFDIWSKIPTFLIENDQAFAETHRQEIAQSLAAGILACLNE
jgi:N-acetylmuramoyl-L-alanine amidase